MPAIQANMTCFAAPKITQAGAKGFTFRGHMTRFGHWQDLVRCARFYPHSCDTGAFFVGAFQI